MTLAANQPTALSREQHIAQRRQRLWETYLQAVELRGEDKPFPDPEDE